MQFGAAVTADERLEDGMMGMPWEPHELNLEIERMLLRSIGEQELPEIPDIMAELRRELECCNREGAALDMGRPAGPQPAGSEA
jgi:hypothetical protein